MPKAYILAGTNLEDRGSESSNLPRRALAKGGGVTAFSSCFETEPVGFLDQPWFLNQAIELETQLEPRELLLLCQSIEASRGRIRTFPNAPRTLDLDILLYGDAVINQEDLVCPAPAPA